jgi:hypothetical protein
MDDITSFVTEQDFNLNLATYCDIESIPKDKVLLKLRKSFLVNLQTKLGEIISRQGIAMF